MKKFILLLVTIICSCSAPEQKNNDKWALKVIQYEISELINRFNELEQDGLMRSNSMEIVNNLRSAYKALDKDTSGKDFEKNKTNLEAQFDIIKNKTSVVSDLDAYNISKFSLDDDFKLKLRASELSVLLRLYDYYVSGNLIFRKHRIIQVPGKDGFTDLYFTAYLDSSNSSIFFASVDTTNFNYTYDTLNKSFYVKEGHYSVKFLDKRSSRKGVLKFKNPNGSYDNYPFKMER